MSSTLRGTCAVVFHADGGADYGLDAVTPVGYTLGVVVSQSRDGLAIRAVEDIHGTRHPATRYTYRLPTLYPCAMRAVLRTGAASSAPCPVTVDDVRRLVRQMIHRPPYRGAVIGHDLDRSCECGARGWAVNITYTNVSNPVAFGVQWTVDGNQYALVNPRGTATLLFGVQRDGRWSRMDVIDPCRFALTDPPTSFPAFMAVVRACGGMT